MVISLKVAVVRRSAVLVAPSDAALEFRILELARSPAENLKERLPQSTGALREGELILHY
jgi:hypothetical protein